MYYINYFIIFLLIVFEVYTIYHIIKINTFKKADIYLSQFLIEGLIFFVLSNILLLVTFNFFGTSKGYINQFMRVCYLFICCKASLNLTSYVFNHISISKKIDILSHILLLLAYSLPIILIVISPLFTTKMGINSINVFKFLSENSIENLLQISFIKDIYMYILGYKNIGSYFNYVVLASWGVISIIYIIIAVVSSLKSYRVYSKRFEFFHLYQAIFAYVLLSIFLIAKPSSYFVYIAYYLKIVFEVFIFILVNMIGKSGEV